MTIHQLPLDILPMKESYNLTPNNTKTKEGFKIKVYNQSSKFSKGTSPGT